MTARTWLQLRRQSLAFVLTREWLLWTLVAVFTLRLVFFVVADPDRPDGVAILTAGRDFLHDPGGLYTTMADFIRRTGYMAAHGWSGPPGGLLVVLPFAALPPSLGLDLWTLGDGLAILAALLLLVRVTRPEGWQRPLLFLTAAYFPPVFADIQAGQIGGYLLLLASGSIWLHAQERSGWAGALAGWAAAIKLYPAAMVFGAGRRLRAFLAGMVVAAVAISAAGFARIGPGGVSTWLSRVLLPSLRSPFPDCEVNSPHTLLGRTLGGDPYYVINPAGGLTRMQSPLHLATLAGAGTDALLLVLVAAVIWSAWKSGWHPAYGLSLGFALGALVPAEVNVYQMLPLLPVVLVTGVRAAERRAYGVLGLLALPMLPLLRQPCYLPFPDLWSLAMLALFAVCAWNWRLFSPAD